MLSSLGDESLIARVAKGDTAALDALFRRHHARVHALCARLAPQADPDDLVQETFLRVLRFAGGFRAQSSLSTWLYRIAVNVCADERQAARRRMLPVVEAPSPEIEDPRIELLERAVAQLSADSRAALVLSRWHDRPYAEIAEILGCSVGAARVRVHRAIAELRQIMMQSEVAE